MKATQTRNALIKSLLIITMLVAALLPACCEAQTKPSGIVAWWKGEQNTTEEIQPLSPFEAEAVTYAPAVVGQGFSSAFRVFNTSTALRLQDFTIEGWVKRSSNRAAWGGLDPSPGLLGVIFGFADGGYSLRLQDNGALVLHQSFASGPLNPYSGVISPTGLVRNDGSFHHVAVTKSGEEVIFYVDGVQRDSQTFSTTFTFDTDIGIGRSGDGSPGSWFMGLLDELAVYNRALSAVEITNLVPATAYGVGIPYNQQPPSINTALRGYYTGTFPYSMYEWSTNREVGFSSVLIGSTNGCLPKISRAFGAGSLLQEWYSDQLTLHNFSVVGWIKRTSSEASSDPDGGAIVSWGTNGWGFFLQDDGSLKLSNIGGISVMTGPSTIPADDTYHHVAVTKTNDVVCIYADGALISTLTFNTVFDFSTAAPFGIGSRWDDLNNSYNTINADMDEIAIYGRALSLEEVRATKDATENFWSPGLYIVIANEAIPYPVIGQEYYFQLDIVSHLDRSILIADIIGGSLPDGLTINPNGVISGTPLPESASWFNGNNWIEIQFHENCDPEFEPFYGSRWIRFF